jgi:hypothetical protein
MLLLSCLSRTADETGACSLCQSTPALLSAVGSSIWDRDLPHRALHLSKLHLQRSCLQRRTCIDTAHDQRGTRMCYQIFMYNLRPATGVQTELGNASLLGVRSMLRWCKPQVIPDNRPTAKFGTGSVSAKVTGGQMRYASTLPQAATLAQVHQSTWLLCLST